MSVQTCVHTSPQCTAACGSVEVTASLLSTNQCPHACVTQRAVGGDTHMTEEEEGKEKGQPSPHPRLETLYGGGKRTQGIVCQLWISVIPQTFLSNWETLASLVMQAIQHRIERTTPELIQYNLTWRDITAAVSVPTNCQVHVVPFAQSSEPVQTAALVVVLEELDKAYFA